MLVRQIVLVSGEDRSIPLRLVQVLEGGEIFLRGGRVEVDGCTLSPDRLPGGVELWPACAIHDEDYRVGGGWRDRQAADARFRRNLRILMLVQGVSRPRAEFLAWLYWSFVRRFGHARFAFSKGEEPLSHFQRMREVWLPWLG